MGLKTLGTELALSGIDLSAVATSVDGELKGM